MKSPGVWMPWFSWQVAQPGLPISANALAWTLFLKRSAVSEWHCPQTLPTQLIPGGTAPWLPWQSLQVGAERSPLAVIAFQWTEVLYFATWSVGIL